MLLLQQTEAGYLKLLADREQRVKNLALRNTLPTAIEVRPRGQPPEERARSLRAARRGLWWACLDTSAWYARSAAEGVERASGRGLPGSVPAPQRQSARHPGMRAEPPAPLHHPHTGPTTRRLCIRAQLLPAMACSMVCSGLLREMLAHSTAKATVVAALNRAVRRRPTCWSVVTGQHAPRRLTTLGALPGCPDDL